MSECGALHGRRAALQATPLRAASDSERTDAVIRIRDPDPRSAIRDPRSAIRVP